MGSGLTEPLISSCSVCYPAYLNLVVVEVAPESPIVVYSLRLGSSSAWSAISAPPPLSCERVNDQSVLTVLAKYATGFASTAHALDARPLGLSRRGPGSTERVQHHVCPALGRSHSNEFGPGGEGRTRTKRYQPWKARSCGSSLFTARFASSRRHPAPCRPRSRKRPGGVVYASGTDFRARRSRFTRSCACRLSRRRAAAEDVDHLGHDADCDLGGCLGADGDADRRINTVRISMVDALFLCQKLEDGIHPPLRADHADVSHRAHRAPRASGNRRRAYGPRVPDEEAVLVKRQPRTSRGGAPPARARGGEAARVRKGRPVVEHCHGKITDRRDLGQGHRDAPAPTITSSGERRCTSTNSTTPSAG